MNVINLIITSLLFILIDGQGYEQFNCRGNSFRISYPKSEEGVKSNQSYHEGDFTTIIYSDSSFLLIHCGSMVNRPFFRGENLVLQDSSNVANRLSRAGYEKKTGLFWREDYYSDKKITIGYSNVKREDLKSFDSSLSSILFN